MQRSPYSAYDELHAETLKYINQSKLTSFIIIKQRQADHAQRTECGISGPITTQPPVISPNGTTPDACGGGNKYTVKAGDTCNKISLAHSVVRVKHPNPSPNHHAN